MRHRIAIALAIALLGLPTAARADDDAGKRVAYGAGSAFGTLVYAPVKASVCILGAIGSGFTYMVDSQTAGKVARSSCGRTWVITPNAVAGKESVHFLGNTAPDDGRHAAAAPARNR